MVPQTVSLDLSDIQGFLINDYHDMAYSRYLLLQVTDAVAAKKFISMQTGSITNAATATGDNRLNIAFTAPGLNALGMDKANVHSFLREFREGMTTPHRQRLLGDTDSSAPENWAWGGPKNDEVHMLLMVFGKDRGQTQSYISELQQKLNASGLKEVFGLDVQVLPGHKEHFGFRDGISQPFIKGSGKTGKDSDMLSTGEFLMGYPNEYGVFPDAPLLAVSQGDPLMLEDDTANSGYKNIGHNGTYLVIRQLEQDVKAYWTFINENAKAKDEPVNTAASRKLAAKMMGRWPSGAPIVKWPDEDPAIQHPDMDPSQYIDDNDFLFNENGDTDGMKCPFGAHIRRTNPRDSFENDKKDESIKLSNRHRIIRRARSYGDPIIGTPDNYTPDGKVGMIFNCFNADISRQFEFIQYTWANYPKFKQLVNDPDPIIGIRESPGEIEQVFTIPAHPANKYISRLQRFVTVKGGGYFFFPSMNVIKYLTTL